MGRKGGKYKRKEKSNPLSVKSSRNVGVDEDMMNDEIDAFHKSRDIIPLDINEDMEDSDEDDEMSVLDLKDDEDDYVDDGENRRGLAAKIVRTQKYLQSKFGGVDDEILNDADEEEQEKVVWGRKKDMYGADIDYEPQSSDDEDAAEEEAEVLKLQSEKAKALSMEDFGLEDSSQDEDDGEPTFEEIMDHRKTLSNASRGTKHEAEMTYNVIKRDLNALTKEEQMDVVSGSAPELIGLLLELNDALDQLENKVSPLVEKIEGQDSSTKGKLDYIEVKHLVLLCYCQAISFYLLLKSEGQPVRDHPVVSRLVEIKSLMDKIEEIDKNLPFEVEDILKKNAEISAIRKSVEENAELRSDFQSLSQIPSRASAKESNVEPEDAEKFPSLSISKKNESEQNHQEEKVGLKSKEMLKIRASLEEKLKQKGVFSSIVKKNHRVEEPLQPMNRQLATVDDFIDEGLEEGKGGHLNGSLQHAIPRSNKRKVISGDDDVPRRDDIGERRRKHELRVLAGAGIEPVVDEPDTNVNSSDDIDGKSDSDPDVKYYHEMEKQHAAKRALKSIDRSRTTEVSSLPDTADGKRLITYQMEKNRGLTRHRKKLTKNPRKKYKLKHKKAEIRRKGQVRAIRKPAGPYGGEVAGINAAVSHSIRFKG